jgi:AhpD family alkylhydroperoxidase
MSQIIFKNTRFNPESTPFLSIAKQMAEAFGYTAKNLVTDNKLAQLLRLRVAQKNECSYCVILHSKTAREIGIPEEKVDNISSWYNSELFTTKEKATLAYCDALTEGTKVGFQKFHQAMTQYFSEVEIAEIAAIIINMNVWTRLKLAQGETPYFE